jgi:hypothetical protein
MTSKISIRSVVAMFLLTGGLLGCAQMPGGGKAPSAPGGGGAPSMPSVPSAGGACPNLASVEGIARVDFAREFKLDVAASGKVKAGLEAAAELRDLSAQIDGDLKTACGTLASNLGERGSYASGEDACRAAIRAMGAARAKIGAKAKIALVVRPPRCAASVDAMADCAARCDATVKPGKLDVQCKGGELSGECSGSCQGSCDMSAGGQCDGECSGSCSAEFSGSCDGNCNGKCDGKTSKGVACAGKCEGKCDGEAKGSCKGKCEGHCEFHAAAKCQGTCTGKCSVEFKAPRCTGDVEPPKVSAHCKARCDAHVSGKLECTPAHVALRIEGAADAHAAASYKAALEKSLPAVLKVAIGMKDRVGKVAGSVRGVVEGIQASAEGMSKGGPVAAARFVGCVAEPFKAALDAAASLQASVKVSVDVKASASASAGGKASAGG